MFLTLKRRPLLPHPILQAPIVGSASRIFRAAKSSFNAINCNANLGILLLTAPLACAATSPSQSGSLRDRLEVVLDNTTIEDAARTFAAIAYVNPAGLGRVPHQDVTESPTVTLTEAMGHAASYDRIARAYTTGFSDIFDFGLDALAEARKNVGQNKTYAITTLHMKYLATWPDSHVGRKYGEDVANTLKERIQALSHLYQPVATPKSHDKLLALDQDLKRDGLNPGTTADLVVATLFTERLIELISLRNLA